MRFQAVLGAFKMGGGCGGGGLGNIYLCWDFSGQVSRDWGNFDGGSRSGIEIIEEIGIVF